MPAKKKSRRAQRPTAEMRRLAEDNADLLAERARLRKELAEARRGRETWCHKAVECEEAKERAELALKDVLAGITTPRPSVPSSSPRPMPAPTFGLPGDVLPDPRRFSREFRP